MATQLYPTVTQGVATPEWLDSEHYRFLTGGVTIDPALVPLADGVRAMPSGSVITRQANGMWGPAAASPAAGSYNALLWERVDVTAGAVATGALDHGRVVEARLPAAPTAGQRTALPGIIFR